MLSALPTVGVEGYGQAFYLAKSGTYRNWLAQNGIDPGKMVSTLAAGYAALTSDTGDTLYVFPGEHTVTASLTWSKHNTHLVGLGTPNQRLAATAGATGMVRLKCVTTTVGQIALVTGHYVSFRNIQTHNSYSAAGNLYDVLVRGKNFYGDHCSFRGGNGAAQLGAVAGVPVCLDSSQAGGDGNMALFERCTFGSAGNGARTVGPASLLFKGANQGAFDAIFKECVFEGRIEQSDAAASLVWLESGGTDRYQLFDNCLFYNFWVNHGGKLDFAVVDANGATHDIIFKDCALVGIDALCNVATHAWTNIANAGTDGGKASTVDVAP